MDNVNSGRSFIKQVNMIRYLLVMAMIILTPPKGSGGMPLAPKPAVIEARVWDSWRPPCLSWSQGMKIGRTTPLQGR